MLKVHWSTNFCICGTTISNTFSHQSNEFMISMEYDVYYFRYNLHCMRIRFFFNIFVYHWRKLCIEWGSWNWVKHISFYLEFSQTSLCVLDSCNEHNVAKQRNSYHHPGFLCCHFMIFHYHIFNNKIIYGRGCGLNSIFWHLNELVKIIISIDVVTLGLKSQFRVYRAKLFRFHT